MKSYRFKTLSLAMLALTALLCTPLASAGYQLALSEFEKGNYDKASATFQALVEQSPSYDFGHYMLGLCHLKSGEPQAAAERFRTALAFNTDRFEYFHGLAQALQQSGHYAAAIQTLNSAEELVEDEARLQFHYTRGMVHMALSAWQDAISDFEIAHEIKPDHVLLMERMAHSYYKVGRYDDAIPLLRESIAIGSGTASSYRLLAESLMAHSNDEDEASAQEALQAAVNYRASRPDDPYADDLAGRAALAAGRFDEAAAAFNAVLEASPANCSAGINLALSLLASSQPQGAEQALPRAEDCGSLQSHVNATLGMIYRVQGSYQQALEQYEEAYDILPASSTYQAIQEIRHNIEARVHNAAADRDRREADQRERDLQEKIERWNQFIAED